MRTRPIAALALAATLVFSPSPAYAAPSLSEYMETVEGSMWDKLQDWLELWHDEQHGEAPAPVPEPAPTQDPTPEPEPTARPALADAKAVATGDNRIVLTGRITGHEGEVTFRASANRLTGQAGYPVQGTPGADGTVRLEVVDFNNTDPKFWQLELGGSTRDYGKVLAAGDVAQAGTAPTPTPPATTQPSAPDPDRTTGGAGGAYTNRTFQNFASNGFTSRYHVYAEGIDRSKPVGLIMYGDGSGGHGFDNPGSSYLIGGAGGLAAVARKHNMVLVVPEAPAPGCPSDNCWYDGANAAGKARWSDALMTHVKSQYPIDNDRIVTGGYSSGAQWHRWFLPMFAEKQSVDLAVMIAYGGAPGVSANYSTAYKDDLELVWNTGTADAAYSTASYGARGGYAWYTQQGFGTEATWPEGVGHGRSGEFGGILDRGISQHLR